MARSFTRCLALCGVAAVTLVAAQPSWAQARSFNIPAEDARQAIPEFARQAGVQISAPAEGGIRTNPVKGTLDVNSALRQLIEGTGLEIASTSSGMIVLRMAENPRGNAGAAETAASLGEAVVGSAAAANGSAEQAIVVTGSHIRGATTASPTTVLDRETFSREGDTTVSEAIQHLPQNFGGGANPLPQGSPGRDAQFNVGVGSSINLRGLGSDATLVLLNGHRTAVSGFGTFVDLSLVPLSAVDRIEIVEDGSSAIYGSDAIGGVANIILRKDYSGAETSLEFGDTADGGASQIHASQLFGTNWRSGNFLLGLDFLRDNRLPAADRSFSRQDAPADILPLQKRKSGYASLRQDLGSSVSIDLDALYSRRDYTKDLNPAIFHYTKQFGKTEQYNLSGTLDARLGGAWRLTFVPYYSRNKVTENTQASILIQSFFDYGEHGADLSIDGPLFSVGGGEVKLAAGTSYRHESISFSGTFVTPGQHHARNIAAGFAEVSVPFVSDENAVPGLKALSFDGAIRYEHYSDFGHSFNPKIGLSWSPVLGLRGRFTWGTSFKAPHFSDQFGVPQNVVAFDPSRFGVPDPGSPTGSSLVLALQGSNPDLKPETSKQWTIGFDWSPQADRGAKVSATYFDIHYKNRIDVPVASLLDPFTNPADAGILDRSFDLQQVNALLAIPTQRNLYGPFTASDVQVIENAGVINTGALTVSGIDFVAHQPFKLGKADFDAGFNASYLIRYNRRILPSSPNQSYLNNLFYPSALKVRADVSAALDKLSATLFINYTSKYHNNTVTPHERVRAWTTLDGTIRYELPAHGVLSNVILGVSATNILNSNPPFIQSPVLTDPLHYDGTNASPLGRFVSASITKRW